MDEEEKNHIRMKQKPPSHYHCLFGMLQDGYISLTVFLICLYDKTVQD